MKKPFGYVIRLLKKREAKTIQFPESVPGGMHLFAYGYYDAVEVLPLPSLLYKTWETGQVPIGNAPEGCQHQDVIFERIFPDNGESGDEDVQDMDLSQHKFACISFLLLDEEQKARPGTLGQTVKALRKIEMPQGYQVEFSYTFGSSALGLLFLVTQPDSPEASGQLYGHVLDYLDRLRAQANSLLAEEAVDGALLLGTYSIFGFHKSLLDGDVSFLQAAYPQRIPSVTLNMRTIAGADVKGFAQALHKELFDEELPEGLLVQTVGNEDFSLQLREVPLGRLLSLSAPGGIRDEAPAAQRDHDAHYQSFCYDYITMIGGTHTSEPLGFHVPAPPSDTFRRAEWVRDVEELEALGFSDMAKALRMLAEHLESLSASMFTRWIWIAHKEAIERFRTTLVQSARLDPAVALRASEHFHFILSALDCLAFTSAYSSDNPGYHKMQDDYSARLIVCYNRMLNGVTSSWERFNKACKSHVPMRDKLGATQRVMEHSVFCGVNLLQSGVTMEIFDNNVRPGDVIFIKAQMMLAYQPFFTIAAMGHELGHAIGPCHRQNRLQYYAQIMADMLCNRLLVHLLSDGEEVVTPEGDAKMRKAKINNRNQSVIQALYTWRDVFAEEIRKTANDRLKMSAQHCNEHSQSSKECNCPVCVGIGKHVKHAMGLALCRLLASEVNWPACIARDFRRNHDQGEQMWEILYNKLRWAWSQLCIELLYADVNALFNADRLLAEPLSDYFMVRLCGCSASQYLAICFWLICDKQRNPHLSSEERKKTEQSSRLDILDAKNLSRFLAMLDVVFGLRSYNEVIEAGKGSCEIFKRNEVLLAQYKSFVDTLANQHKIYCVDKEEDIREAPNLRAYRMHYSFDAVRDYLRLVTQDPRMEPEIFNKLGCSDSDTVTHDILEAQESFEMEKGKMKSLFQASWEILKHSDDPEHEHKFLDMFLRDMYEERA